MTYSPPGPQLDQHIGREHECYQRIALLSRHIPANILSHGCQTEVALLCTTADLTVKAMLDTGCSPGNYMSDAFYQSHIELLKEFLVPGKAERVDLATNNSAKQLTQHIVIDVRHVDSRGTTRILKLRFGVLDGLRFDIVIGLYAIAMNFMEVMQDLLTLQLEHQEAKTNNLAMLYGQQPCLLMINGEEDADTVESTEYSPSVAVLPRGLRPPILTGLTAQTMRRNPWYYDAEQLADQEAYEMLHPVPWEDHNDGDDVMSQDTIEAPTQPYTVLRRQQNAAIAAAHNVHAVNEDSNAYGVRRYYKDDPYQHSRSDGTHPAMTSNLSASGAPHLQGEDTRPPRHHDTMPMARNVSAVDENLHESMVRKYYKDDPRQHWASHWRCYCRTSGIVSCWICMTVCNMTTQPARQLIVSSGAR